MMLILLFGIFLVFLFMGMPVAYAMSISACVTLFFDPNLPGLIIPQKMFTAMDSFSLMAIPFFMLAGSLMEQCGITKKLVGFARSLVGHFTGGLGHATIVTGVLMAGVSGSANADTAAIASILVPALRDEGYDDGYACAMVSGWWCWLSGLWHQRQRRGHPLRNTVVRMPGPSCMAYRLMSKISPSIEVFRI